MFLGLALGACSKGCAPEPSSIQARGTLSSLLAHGDQLRIVEQRKDFRVRQRLVKPRANGTDAFGESPALEVSPPCEVRYEVPASHPRAILRVASCIHAGQYHGEIAVNDHLKEFYAGTEGDAEVVRLISEYQLALYDAEIAEVDEVIGDLLELLAELGLKEQTIVAVTSDHGEEFLEHSWAGHHNQLFDESVRVPLIFHGPGIPAGVVRPECVENRFLGGTLLRLCEAELPSNLHGFHLLDPGLQEMLTETPVFLTNSNGRWVNFDERSCGSSSGSRRASRPGPRWSPRWKRRRACCRRLATSTRT